MTQMSQQENVAIGHIFCNSLPFKMMRCLSYSAGLMASAERVGSRIRELRQLRRLTQEQLGELIGSDGPRVGRLEKGTENPTLETIDKLAKALEVDVSDLFVQPRPDEESGDAHAAAERPRERNQLLDAWLASIDAEVPADESWRGDVLKAVAVLNRALRRPDPGTSASPTKKTGS